MTNEEQKAARELSLERTTMDATKKVTSIDGTIKMIGTNRLKTNTGCSYPGNLPVSFTRADVHSFGKSCWYGSNVTWFWVRLKDGTELNVKAYIQPKEAKKWLSQLSARLGFVGLPSRDCPEVFAWDVVDV